MEEIGRYPSHNLGLDLIRATEAAALVAGRWMGRGESLQSDRVATAAMRAALNTIAIDGRIVFSERDKLALDAPLHPGEPIGSGSGPAVDLVVDPIEGRKLLAYGHPDAIAVAAAAPRDAFWSAAPAIYMEKIIVGPEVAPVLVPECLDAPAAWTLALIARAKGKAVSDLAVFLLNRQRHTDLVDEIRTAGARVVMRTEGDVVGALKVLLPTGGVDMLMGVGGLPEGLAAACAVKAARGAMLGRLAPQSDAEHSAIKAAGLDTQRILTVDELVTSDDIFFTATGITDGSVLTGVHYHGKRATSHSLIMRGETHTRRIIQAEHLLK